MYKYAFKQYDKELMARGHKTNMPISLKKAVEMARELRGKNVAFCLRKLQRVQELQEAVAYRKYTMEVGHKKGKGMAAGGYPVKAAGIFSDLIKNAFDRFKQDGVNEKDVTVMSISVRKGVNRWHPGRRRMKMKSTHIEVILKKNEVKA